MSDIDLFEINGNNVEVYTAYRKLDKLKEFRASILEHKKLFYRLETVNNSPKHMGNKLKEGVYRFSQQRLNDMDDYAYLNTYNFFYSYTPAAIKRDQKNILAAYVNGNFSNLKYEYLPQTTYHFSDDKEDGVKQLHLLVSTSQTKSNCSPARSIENILSLPKDHFQLHMLLNGQYNEICDEKLLFDPNLFSLLKSDSININRLYHLSRIGLINDSIDDIYQKVETTAKILKQLRK